MAVIIRERKTLDGKEYNDVTVFKSENLPILYDEEKKALELDIFLRNFFKSLIKETEENKLIELKGKNGVIELWYFVGTKLKFVDDPVIINSNDKKFIWKALWFHADKLVHGEMKSRAGTNRDHFYYCYKLAKYDKEFVTNAGTWRDWMDFFDSPILSNINFISWFETKVTFLKSLKIKNWLREFIKLVRNEFQNIDMSFLKKEEIKNRCEKLHLNFLKNYNNNIC